MSDFNPDQPNGNGPFNQPEPAGPPTAQPWQEGQQQYPTQGTYVPTHDIGEWIASAFRNAIESIPQLAPLLVAQLVITGISTWIGFRALEGIEFVNLQSIDEGDLGFFDIVNFDSGLIIQAVLIGIAAAVAGTVLNLATTYILLQKQHGTAANTADSLGVGFQKLLPFIGWTIVSFLWWILPVALFVGGSIVIASVSGNGGIIALLSIVGFFVAIPLAIWYFVKISFLRFAAVSDRRTKSIWSSTFQTSEDNFWPVFGRLLLSAVLLIIPSFIINLIFQSGFSVNVETTGESAAINGVPVENLDMINLGELIPGSDGTGIILLLISTALGTAIGWFQTGLHAGIFAFYNREEAKATETI